MASLRASASAIIYIVFYVKSGEKADVDIAIVEDWKINF